MLEILRSVLVLLSSAFAGFYILCGVLFAFQNQWLLSNMHKFFPVLHRMTLSYATTLGQFLIWSLILPLVTYGISTNNANVMLIGMALSVVEVYLGFTFYMEINDITGAWVHVVLHTAIIAALASLLVWT
jgi:hypothetical protein